MVDENLDRDDILELIDDLAPRDQQQLVQELSESFGGSVSEEAPDLDEEIMGEFRNQFLQQQVTNDYEALGELLTLELLSGAKRQLAESGDSVENVQLDLEAHIEPITPRPGGKLCFEVCIVNGIFEPICWRVCIVDGIY